MAARPPGDRRHLGRVLVRGGRGLDVIQAVRGTTTLPLSAYNVSGEYAAVKAAAERGWLDEARVVRENLYAIRRAGADQIITYHARDALQGRWL